MAWVAIDDLRECKIGLDANRIGQTEEARPRHQDSEREVPERHNTTHVHHSTAADVVPVEPLLCRRAFETPTLSPLHRRNRVAKACYCRRETLASPWVYPPSPNTKTNFAPAVEESPRSSLRFLGPPLHECSNKGADTWDRGRPGIHESACRLDPLPT